MTPKLIDAVALGSCYVDVNAAGFSFGPHGIPGESEAIGQSYGVVPGGSAVNFCRLLGTLDLHTAFIGVAGNDLFGNILEDLLRQDGVQPLLTKQEGLQTSISFNSTSTQGDHIMQVAGDANKALGPETVMPRLQEILPRTTMLYLGGCFKLQTLAPAFGNIATLAKQHSADIVVDHGRVPDNISPPMLESVKNLVLKATFYLPSNKEFCQVWDVATIKDGLKLLHQQAPHLTVVVKDGANGAFYWADGGIRQVETQKVEAIVSATGAGDSFNAGLMCALAKGLAIPEAIAYGTKVAAAKIAAKKIPLLGPQ